MQLKRLVVGCFLRLVARQLALHLRPATLLTTSKAIERPIFLLHAKSEHICFIIPVGLVAERTVLYLNLTLLTLLILKFVRLKQRYNLPWMQQWCSACLCFELGAEFFFVVSLLIRPISGARTAIKFRLEKNSFERGPLRKLRLI